jgi:hypothetical protein
MYTLLKKLVGKLFLVLHTSALLVSVLMSVMMLYVLYELDAALRNAALIAQLEEKFPGAGRQLLELEYFPLLCGFSLLYLSFWAIKHCWPKKINPAP